MKEIKNQIKSGHIKKCYLFFGQEEFLKKSYEEKIKNFMIEPSFEMMNYMYIEDKFITSEKIINFCETIPFFSNKKLIVIKNSGFFKGIKDNNIQRENDINKEINIIDEYLKNIPDNVCIIFSEYEVDKRKKIYKTVLDKGYICEFKTPNENDIINWILKNLKKSNIFIDKTTASYLIRNSGNKLEILSREIEKLKSYKNENEEVSIIDIDNICTKSIETKIFDLVAKIGEKKPEEAIKIYRNLLSMKEYPTLIFNMIIRQFRMILQCFLLLNNGEDLKNISAILGIHDFIVRECLKQSKNFSEHQLKSALRECLDIDLNIKTGKINPEIAIEMIILKYSI